MKRKKVATKSIVVVNWFDGILKKTSSKNEGRYLVNILSRINQYMKILTKQQIDC